MRLSDGKQRNTAKKIKKKSRSKQRRQISGKNRLKAGAPKGTSQGDCKIKDEIANDGEETGGGLKASKDSEGGSENLPKDLKSL